MRKIVAVLMLFAGLLITTGSAQASTLFGTTTIEGTSDSLTGSHSEVFRYESPVAGTATGVEIYLTSSTGVKVAVYGESESKPKALLATGEVGSNTAKTWVAVTLEHSIAVAKSTHYWIALEPTKGGKVSFRDHASGATDYEGSGFANPWSTIETYPDGPMSAYVTGEESKKFSCPAGSLTPNGEGIVSVTTNKQLVCGQEAKEIEIAAGVDGTVIEHNLISGGGEGIVAGGVNCSVANGPVYEGCESQPAFTNTLIAYNNIKGPFTEDAIHTNNFKGLTIEHNWLHGFKETGNHTDGWQNVWGGEEVTFAHNVISEFVGEGTILKDGDISGVHYDDNLILSSGVDGTAPEGEAELQTFGVHGLELLHNTFANNTPKAEIIRTETTGASAKYNVFDNLEVIEGGALSESQNNLDEEPWSFFPSATDKFGTPTFTAGWQTTKKAEDGTTLGIDFPASEVQEEAGLP
jgi:hypothetical protein